MFTRTAVTALAALWLSLTAAQAQKPDKGQATDQKSAEAKKSTADQDKAKAEVKDLQAQLDKLHEQMRETAKKLMAAREKAGMSSGHRHGRWHGHLAGAHHHHGWHGPHHWAHHGHGGWHHHHHVAWGGHGSHRHGEARGSDTDRRLDRLQHEVGELRRELRERKK